VEVIYAALKEGKFINRGFLNGPLCPIYGFGVIAVVNFLKPVQNNLFFLFFGSVFIASAIELTAGFVLEKIFRQKWWDYSEVPFNIGGYICPLFSMMWGIACLVIVDQIHPLIVNMSAHIPEPASLIILLILSIVFVIDLVATVNTILRINKKLEHIEDLSLLIRKSTDELGENLATGVIALSAKKDELEELAEHKKEEIVEKITHAKKTMELKNIARKQKLDEALQHKEKTLAELKKANREILEAGIFGQGRLLKAFPNIKSTLHNEALEKLKDHIFKSTDI
jgi:uncharacterized membrane protein